MLSAPRRIVRRDGVSFDVGVAAGVTILQSALVILAGGFARPGRQGQGADDSAKGLDAATYHAVGVAQDSVVGGAVDGAVALRVQAGCWNFKNSAGADAVALADVGKTVFVVDDETIAKTSASGTRCAAGVLLDLDAEGAWVLLGPGLTATGVAKIRIPFAINETDTLAGTSAEIVSPVDGNITELGVIVQKDVTTGGPVTVSVGGVAVNGLAAVVANAAVKGTVLIDVPTPQHASRAVAKGGRIQVIPDAAFAGTGAISGYVEITL